MQNYLCLLKNVLDNGEQRPDRTGVGTIGTFGGQLTFDLRCGFPIITTKSININAVIHELLWFISGSTNIRYLRENRINIWNEWADENGDLGRIYGAQWRSWRAPNGKVVDQLADVIKQIKDDPFSRRHIVCAWNPGELDEMALPPCHAFFQFHVSTDGGLSCHLYQRSADMFLGVPFNISSYSLLTMMVAHVCRLSPKKFVHTFGDVHIYKNHIEQVKEQLSREPLPLPTMRIRRSVSSIDDFTFDDFSLENYHHLDAIKAPIAV